MKSFKSLIKIVLCIAAGIVLASSLAFSVSSEESDNNNDNDVSAFAYCLYCANNAQIVAAKNENVRLPPASTTKIMTAILGIEAQQADDTDINITMTEDLYAEGSSMYLNSGEVVRLSDVIGGMMMVSGNDAANAIAKTIGGSSEGFAELMNQKARALELHDTHFVTPSGLDANEHFTTAYDLARLMAYCMENDEFRAVVSSSSITVDFVLPYGKTQTYYNENKLLRQYEYCIGGKTGYTDLAGRTLVSCAEKDGVKLICVTLNDPNDWNDHEQLFEYGFSVMSMTEASTVTPQICIDVVGGEEDSVETTVGQPPLVCQGTGDVQTHFEVPPFLYAPITKGQQVGSIKYYTNGVYAGKADIFAAEDIELSNSKTNFIENIVSFYLSCWDKHTLKEH